VNRHAALLAREADGRPVRVGLIGAGAFGGMFAAQARRTPGMELAVVADLDVGRASARLRSAGWAELPVITDDVDELLAFDGLDVVVEATGHPVIGLRHAMRAIDGGRHVVMVNVEADVLAGPGLAARARRAGVVYSLAYGDQPALICEQVDWARTAGFDVIAAGKGTKYQPEYHAVTPDDVWEHYGLGDEQVTAGGLNARMFTSFLDGTKSAIEMAAVANATGLDVPADGLAFPPAGADELATVFAGSEGVVEVVASERRDGSPVERDLRWGVFVVVHAADDYVAARFSDYGLATDPSGRYAALYRPYHMIGLELGVSVAAVALEGQPTGAPLELRGEVAAVAKRDLAAGEALDGEGGYTVWGKLLPAAAAGDALPIGLAHGARLTTPVPAGEVVRLGGVELADGGEGLALRDELLAEGAAA
jgi:predicted homoserine dehydrogenase-like protein